jgi:hypothetical protein
MPTPNVSAIVESVAIATENSRPSRPHVACPEDVSNTHTTTTTTTITTAGWGQQELDHPRQDTAVASPCPSEDPGLDVASPSAPSTDDEKVYTVSTVTEQRTTTTPAKEAQSSQKIFTRRAPSHGIPASIDSPSSNSDFSTKRVSLSGFLYDPPGSFKIECFC